MDIRFSGVSKIFYPDITALEDVYLEIPKGEFVYLVGPTGSGKTTLLRCVTREVAPTRGQITVGSFSLRKINRLDLSIFRRDIGIVFQDFCLLPHLNVFENVAFVLEVLGAPPREVKERAGEILDRVNLWRRRFLYPPQLSGGEQQRVAVARAIVNSPSVLLADEPTGNLDLRTAEEITQLIMSINSLGTTVIMATHNQRLVDAFRQRVIVIKAGRVVRDEKRGRYNPDGEL
ncbi:MAG: ATP-binding cassette domain-containing protein [Synergistaceae bacterium]|nr:ATP-binding cassette domain-containing protein [Synergistaceae bacterium]